MKNIRNCQCAKLTRHYSLVVGNLELILLWRMDPNLNLSWNNHIAKVHRTISMLPVNVMTYTAFTSYRCLHHILQSVHNNYEFCNTIWGSVNQHRLSRWQKLPT